MPAIGEIFLGFWNLTKMGFSAVGKFLSSLDAQGWIGLIVCIPLAYVALSQWGDARHWHKQSDRNELLYKREHLAFGLTVIAYRTAAAHQKAVDDAKNTRTVAEQQAINMEKSDEYEARLAAARAEYERLSRASASHPGNSTGTAMPSLPTTSVEPSDAAGQDRLSDALTCTAQSIQLDELIKWNLKQHQVDPNR